MNLKMTILVIGVLAVAVMIAAIWFVFFLPDRWASTQGEVEYYAVLARQCVGKESPQCCIASINTMRNGGYQAKPDGGCPDGYHEESERCSDSFVWCARQGPTSLVDANVAPQMQLDFFAGGSIFGHSFEIHATDTEIVYRKTSLGGTREDERIVRSLSASELSELRDAILDADLVNIGSQDFTKLPTVPDQGFYRVSLVINEKKNKVVCGIPVGDERPSLECQRKIDILRKTLNKILDVDIY